MAGFSGRLRDLDQSSELLPLSPPPLSPPPLSPSLLLQESLDELALSEASEAQLSGEELELSLLNKLAMFQRLLLLLLESELESFQ
jgi:hypothetical protein